ncbi:MAG: hypothetical protein CL582_21835 [Alteromonadaceae bacterium]|nr:hypothetical protein [Alteromonadaceae bacterium]|tara:strand:- start:1581 stop:2942 length:1362 start_codon:yes stop_codon:yes gene_type:complete
MVDGYGKPAQAALGPASITLAKVTNVNVQEWTVDLETVFSLQPLSDVPFATPYCHRDHGGGINFIPEVDSNCYVAQCADGTTFIIGFITTPLTQVPTEFDEEGGMLDEAGTDVGPSYRRFRDPLEAGDIMLGTVDDNQIILRRGGMVQIGSTGLAQRVYLPVENIIRDYFQRYQAISPIGEIEWGHAILASGEDPSAGTGNVPNSNYFLDEDQKNALKIAEETPVLVRYNIKDLAQEDVSTGKYTIELRAGRLTKETLDTEVDAEHVFANVDLKLSKGKPPESGITPEERGVISFTIYSHDEGDNQGKVTYAFQLNRDGDNFVFTKGSIRHEVEKDVYASVHGSARMDWGDGAKEASGDSFIEFTKSNEFKQACKNVVMEILESVDITAKDLSLNISGNIDIGEGADNKVVRMEDLQTFMQTQFQCVTAFGPSGPMIPPFSPNVGSSQVKVKK